VPHECAADAAALRFWGGGRVHVGERASPRNNDPAAQPSATSGEGAGLVRGARVKLATALALLALTACDLGGGFGYVEIKLTPAGPQVPLYVDSVKLEAIRSGNAVLRQKVGTVKLQSDSDGGQLAVLCNIEVRKNRITTVTVSLVNRQPRCQCGRTSGTDPAASRNCIG
jgi:hypothetical protein